MHRTLICVEKRDFHRIVDVSRQYAGEDLDKCIIFNKRGYTSELYKEKEINGVNCIIFGWSKYGFGVNALQLGYDLTGIIYEIERTKKGYILMEFEDGMLVNFKDRSKIEELKLAMNVDKLITRDEFSLVYDDKKSEEEEEEEFE